MYKLNVHLEMWKYCVNFLQELSHFSATFIFCAKFSPRLYGLGPGVNVVITILLQFSTIFGEKLAFFLKTNAMINSLNNGNLSQKSPFLSPNFLA
jgi:hypothetical protein